MSKYLQDVRELAVEMAGGHHLLLGTSSAQMLKLEPAGVLEEYQHSQEVMCLGGSDQGEC